MLETEYSCFGGQYHACWYTGFKVASASSRHGTGWVVQTTRIVVPELISSTWVKPNPRYDSKSEYGPGHEIAAVLLPGFARYQLIAKPGNKTAVLSWSDPYIFCSLQNNSDSIGSGYNLVPSGNISVSTDLRFHMQGWF